MKPYTNYENASGQLEAEAIVTVAHAFDGGQHQGQQNGLTLLTGRYRFRYEDGRTTRWYSPEHAPKWMQRLIRMVR